MIRLSEAVCNRSYWLFAQKWGDDGWMLTDALGRTESLTYKDGDYSDFKLCTSQQEAEENFTGLLNQRNSYIVRMVLTPEGDWI